jgi:hypothetical protein
LGGVCRTRPELSGTGLPSLPSHVVRRPLVGAYDVEPGDGCLTAFRVRCPDEPGRYTLAIDLVHEHVSWFSRAGAPPLRIPVKVVR